MELSKVMLHDVRLRILQYIIAHKKANTAAVAAALPDIPRATIYHHIKILEESGMIKVAEERRVRNTMEKLYAPCVTETVAGGANSAELSTAFHMQLLQEMNGYLSGSDADIKRDQVFFSTAYLAVTEEEYRELLGELTELIGRYVSHKKTDGRSLRKLSLISAPPERNVK